MPDSFVQELMRHRPADGWPAGSVTLSARDASYLLGVEPSTLRDWVARGHINRRGRNCYDMGEVLEYLGRRG